MTALGDSSRSGRPDTPARILLVDDNAIQLKLHRLRLADAGFEVETACNAQEALARMRERRPDAIVSDVVMGDVDGFTLCRCVRADAALADIPVVLLSAHYSDDADHALASHVGADLLVPRTADFEDELASIRRTLVAGAPPRAGQSDPTLYEEQLRTTNSRLTAVVGRAQCAEERYRALFERASDVITILTPDGLILEANEQAAEVFGLPRDQIVGRDIAHFALVGREARDRDDYHESVGRGEDRRLVSVRRPDGGVRQVEFATSAIDIDGQPLVLSIGRDLTEKLAGAEALAAAERKFRSLVERIPEVIWSANAAGDITFITPNVAPIMGIERDDLYRRGRGAWISRVHPADVARVRESFRSIAVDHRAIDVEFRWRRGAGDWIWIRSHAVAAPDSAGQGFEGLFADVTAKRRLEDELRQAQKMEAIGQLTGGIAHDFNNILAVISANSHFLLSDLEAGNECRGFAEEIRQASDRAAALTRQLLAFSRRQVLEPKVLDLNEAIAGVEKMLRRVIGEDIDLSIHAAPALGAVKADAGQIEQVLMNLVVNARDAMPHGGGLSISTANVELDADIARPVGVVPPGRYVVLTVADQGHGMSAETCRRIFEPFFTTKERGKGTGLGLSTCYGIVRQSGGHITVDSELGRGTAFTIYLPCVDERPLEVQPPVPQADLVGNGRVLLIEDDDALRSAAARILTSYGYRVTAARDGLEAVNLAGRAEEPIDLILSDVIVPRLNGPAAVAEIRKLEPGTKVLFMSGYADHVVLRDGTLRDGVNFIQKPFSPETLARKARDVLLG